MPESDYGDFDDDDLIAATDLAQAQAQAQAAGAVAPQFALSPRPAKRQKTSSHGQQAKFRPPTAAAAARPAGTAQHPKLVSNIIGNGQKRGSVSAKWQDGNARPSIAAPRPPSDSEEDAFEPASSPPAVTRPSATTLKPSFGNGKAGANSHAGQENIDPTSAASTTQQNHTGVGRSLPKPARPVDHIEVSSDSDDGFGPPVRPVTTTHPATGGGAVRHPIVNGQQQQPVEFDIAKELEDLPSDAFSSTADEGEPNNAQWNPSAAASRPTVTYRGPQNGLRQTTLFGSKGLVGSQANKQYQFEVPVQDEPPTHHKLNREAMKTWVYPINLGSIRDYQFNIVQRGLFQNTLVALPTGLGKTFIAATIMLNWFRWTSDAQILFVAPTKPLVSQQVQACFGIAGIPRSQTTLLTGETGPGLRAEEWASKRVFFMTPQTVINDLKTGTCDPKRIVLVVVDEAHKATGAYAYVEIVKFIRRFNESFRVLALTATPGSDVESVQAIIDNLDIARVEIRTEQSLDIRQYVHGRQVEKFVFENSEEMEMCMDLYSKAVQPLLSKLNGMNAYWSKNPLSLTPYGCNQASRKWASSEAGRKAPFPVKSMVTGIFSVLASLSHSMDLLKFHGMTPFYQGLIGFRNDASAGGYGTKYRQQIVQSEHFDKLMVRLKAWSNSDEFVGHPKLEFLREIVMNHFLDAGDGREGQPPSSTRIMIFAHWRDSAEEIVRILKRSEPMIRPHVFVGQAASKNSEGMDQKRQLDVIQKFKTGVYNTIVATSIGEEGLDIGEVDMIICYDSKASPIRMLQRMGRTGRKRAGKIVLLQMKGKEEEDAAKAKDNYERMQEIIASGTQFTFHQDRNRRMIPKDIHPVVDKCEVDIPLENSQPELPEPKKRPGRQPKRPPKKFHMPDGVDTGFTTASRMNGTHDGQTTQPKAQLRIPKLFEELTTEITEDTATIPPLEDVILNNKQQRDLNNRFLNIADGDNQEIAYPNVNAYPSHQRHLSKTFAFGKAGKASAEFVSLMNRMHNIRYDPTEKWNRENKIAELETTFDQEQDKWQAILPSDDLIVQSDNENVPMTLQEANNDDAVLSDHSFSSLSSLGLPTSKPTTTLRGRGRGRPRGVAARGRTDTNTTRTLSPGPTAVEPTTPPVRGRGRGRGRGQGQTRGRGRGRGRGAGLSASAFIADGFVAEGHSSSPPGTDPLMRIRTQGIDLGSQDTDGWGEEEDEQLDSELAGFIVGDEEDVEEGGEEDDDDDDEVFGDADGTRHVSSGLGLGFSSSFSVVDRGRARGKGGLVRGRNGGTMEIDEDEEDEANEQAAGDGDGTVYDSDSGESLPEVAAIISRAAKKKRHTAISDEEEDDDLHAPRQRGAGGAAASRRRVISDDEDEDDLDLSDDE